MASRNLVNKSKPSFKQQNLPAWQPILTAGTVLPTFFLIGVAFVPIGIGLLMSSTQVYERVFDYTDCKSFELPDRSCAMQAPHTPCTCKIEFHIDQDVPKEIYAYYGLSNFYQNHRRYVKSRDDHQLLGQPKQVSSDCFPFDYADDGKGNKLPIAPCGAIANSKFNDTFDLTFLGPDNPKKVTLSKQGIAWSTDKNIRFTNPPHDDTAGGLAAAFAGTIKPPFWSKAVYELATGNDDNNGFQNEDLIVWMRTAALPTFRKIYAIINLNSIQQDLDHLPEGDYILRIYYNYPVAMFNGRKRFIISNTSWLGGKNHFLGIAYIVVGCICFMLSAFFLYIHKKYGRLPSELTQITQTTPYLTTATTTTTTSASS